MMLLLLAFLLTLQSVFGQDWDFKTFWEAQSIPFEYKEVLIEELDQHITQIDFTTGPRGNFFRFKLYSNGVAKPQAPPEKQGYGCTSDIYFDSLVLDESQRIVQIDFWAASAMDGFYDIFKLQFYISDGSFQTFDSTLSIPNPPQNLEQFSYKPPDSSKFEIKGLKVGTSQLGDDCYTTLFGVASQNFCETSQIFTFDLSSFPGRRQQQDMNQVDQYYPVNVIDNSNGVCGTPQYSVQYSPGSMTADLIDLYESGQSLSILCRKPLDPLDQFTSPYGFYIIARFTGQAQTIQSPWVQIKYLTTDTSCTSASILVSQVMPDPLIYTIGGSGLGSVFQYDPQVGGDPNLCGGFTTQCRISVISPTPASEDLLYCDYLSDSNPTIVVFAFAEEQVGDYKGEITVCLKLFNLNVPCETQSFDFKIVSCIPDTSNQYFVAWYNNQEQQTDQLYDISFDLSNPWSRKVYIKDNAFTCKFSKYAKLDATWQSDVPGSPINQFVLESKTPDELYFSPALNLKQVGTYTIVVSNVQWCNPATIPSCTPVNLDNDYKDRFKIQVTDLYSCQKTTVRPVTPTQISLEVGDIDARFPFESFKDSASFANEDPNLCPKTYKVTISTNQKGFYLTNFQIDNQTNEFVVSTTKLNQIGTYTVTFTGFITQYPYRNATTSFKVVVTNQCDQSQNTLSSPDLLRIQQLPSQLYKVTSPPIKIGYESFFDESIDIKSVSKCLKAYVFQGESYPSQLDLSCSCLSDSSNFNWIRLSYDSSSLQIFATNTNDTGVQTVFVVQSTANNADVIPLAQFKVTLISSTQIQKQPPYFEEALQSMTVEQCTNQTIDPWSYTLPKIVDPQNSKVKVFAMLDNNIFTFDELTQTISQTKISGKPTSYTIQVKLINAHSLQTSYSFEVKFVCPSKTEKVAFVFNLKEQLQKLAAQSYTPTAKLASIDQKGLMLIKFNQKMRIPENSNIIDTGFVNIDGDLYPILDIKVKPGLQSNPSLLNFNWTLVEYQSTQLRIQLHFENQNYISSHNLNRDYISVVVNGFQYFVDSRGNYIAPKTLLGPKSLPNMVTAEQLAAAQALTNTVESVFYSSVTSISALQFFLSSSIQQMLNPIQHPQLIVHLMLINVAFPAITTKIMNVFMNFLTFQLYDLSDFYNRVLGLNTDSLGNQSFNDQFSQMGYSALYLVQNFGMLCLTIFVGPLLWTNSQILSKISPQKFTALKMKWNERMKFNYWAGLLHETYLFMAVCCGINLLFCFQFQTTGDTINSLVSIFLGGAIIIYPLFVAVWFNLPTNYALLVNCNQDFLARFGAAIPDGQNLKRRGRYVLINQTLSILRKLQLACIIVFGQKSPVMSIFQLTSRLS